MKPAGHLRPLLSRLAARLSTPEGGVVLRELQLLGQDLGLGRVPGGGQGARPGGAAPWVGVWTAREGPQGVEFVRDRRMFPFWRSAADVERIGPKSALKRVVLLGESAARGLYFDPAHTPAGVLQGILDSAAPGTCEVVDLAMTAIRPLQLAGLIRQVPALKPDAIVLFGGNNWHWEFEMDRPDAGDAGALAVALRGGVGPYRAEVARRRIASAAERVAGSVAEVARAAGIPAVIVIPAFNLADWRDDLPIPMTDGGTAGEWHRLRAEGETACARADWAGAASSALGLLALDQGLSPAGHRILGRAAQGRGDSASARAHFEAARDAVGGLPHWSCPRCLGTTQEALRAVAARSGMGVVDLAAVLGRDGRVPGRREFLDYCHMTALGMGESMRAAAAAVAGSLGLEGAAERVAGAGFPMPGSAINAAAHLLAAVHNSILGQPDELVDHHCAEAARLDPGSPGLLAALLSGRVADLPDWLDAGLSRACALPNAHRHMIRAILPSEGRHTPVGLLARAASETGSPATEPVRQAIARELASLKAGGRVDLLGARFRPASLHLRHRSYLCAKEPRSRFHLLSPGPGELTAVLCLRVPEAAVSPASVSLLLDGRPVWTGPAGSSWTTVRAEFRCELGSGLVGTLEVAWPDAPARPAAAWRAALDAVDRAEVPDVYPTFGEIHSLVLERGSGAGLG
jgi:hypothetical protein